MRTVTLLALLGMVGLLSGSGCGDDTGPQRAEVEGQVTLDGAPIEKGSIAFYPVEGTTGPSAGGTVENGRYGIPAGEGPVVGTNRVQINAPRKTGRQVADAMGDPGAMTDEIVEAVPPRYNTQSELKREVKPDKNVFDFELTSP
jgi:hypothetical protein